VALGSAITAQKVAQLLRRKLEAASMQRDRRRLIATFGHERSATQTIYFLTPDHPTPSGGIRVIYRHVDILNAAGIRAFVLHNKRGFACDWFEHQTRVTDVASVAIQRDDLLVLPEVNIDILAGIPPGMRHVIFNQNSHLTWRRAVDQIERFYADGPDLAGTVTVSTHNREMLELAFGTGRVHRVRLSIDPALFHTPAIPAPRRIAYMPRRGGDDARQVIEMLRTRGALDGWEVVALDSLSHEEVAVALRTVRIFLSFTYHEGFGLPSAEAMACGAYVIGYHGYGGSEFFDPRFCTPVTTGDIIGFVGAVENVVAQDRMDDGWCARKGRAASMFILETYAPANEIADVTSTYRSFLEVPHGADQRQLYGRPG
jgi:hypothetical protein